MAQRLQVIQPMTMKLPWYEISFVEKTVGWPAHWRVTVWDDFNWPCTMTNYATSENREHLLEWVQKNHPEARSLEVLELLEAAQ